MSWQAETQFLGDLAAAERLGATEVATLDRRHFTVVHPSHVEAFDLLPACG